MWASPKCNLSRKHFDWLPHALDPVGPAISHRYWESLGVWSLFDNQNQEVLFYRTRSTKPLGVWRMNTQHLTSQLSRPTFNSCFSMAVFWRLTRESRLLHSARWTASICLESHLLESLIPSIYLNPFHCPTPVTYWPTQLCLILEWFLHLYATLARDSVPYCGKFWIMSTGQRDFTIQKTYWGNVITQVHFQQGKRGCLGPSITQEQRWREQGCEPTRLGWVVLLPSISVGVPGLAKYQIPGEHLMVG